MKKKQIALILLGILMLFSLAAVDAPEAPAGLPTRPAPTPGPVDLNDSDNTLNGGQILLRTDDGDAAAGLWTLVQWQDTYTGEWYDVDGWHGHFDSIGQVIWWVGAEDLGSGPFRWQIYSDENGSNLLFTSESFMLPAHSGEIISVEIALP